MDPNRDMVMMKGGKMIMVIHGEMLYMEGDILTANGIKVRPDGTIITPDGRTSVMLDDEAVIIDRVAARVAEEA